MGSVDRREAEVHGVFAKLVAVAGRLVEFAREVDRGIAVGRGYAPVGKNVVGPRHAVRLRRGAARGPRVARGRVRAHRVGRRGACGGAPAPRGGGGPPRGGGGASPPRRWRRPSRGRSPRACRTGPTPSSTAAPASVSPSRGRRRCF